MDALKFAAGQVWKDGEGNVETIVSVSDSGEYPVLSRDNGNGDTRTYTLEGQFSIRGKSCYDLVELVEPVASAETDNAAVVQHIGMQSSPARPDDAQSFRDQLIIELAKPALGQSLTGDELMNFIDAVMARRVAKVVA